MAEAARFRRQMRPVFIAVGVYAIGAAVMSFCSLGVHLTLGELTNPSIRALDIGALRLGAIAAKVVLVAYLAAAIFFLIMIHHAAETAGKFKAPFTYCKPGMAVGCWFIPFANWVMPYLLMRDLLRSAADSTGQQRQGLVVGMWWSAFFVRGLFGSFTFVMRFVMRQPPPPLGSLTLELCIQGALELVAALLFLVMLRIWKQMHVAALETVELVAPA